MLVTILTAFLALHVGYYFNYISRALLSIASLFPEEKFSLIDICDLFFF